MPSATAPLTQRTRRNPFTGRVSYVDQTQRRGLRARLRRPIVAATTLTLIAGIAIAAGTPSTPTSAGAATNNAAPLVAPAHAAAEATGAPSGTPHR